MSQYNKLSNIQYARFQILPVDLHFRLFWSAGIPPYNYIQIMPGYKSQFEEYLVMKLTNRILLLLNLMSSHTYVHMVECTLLLTHDWLEGTN